MHKTVNSASAPAALGPYSQAISAGGALFMSGQIPVNPASGLIEAESIEGQTRQVFANLSAVLAEAGMSLADVVKTTVFMSDISEFGAMNAVYGELFGENRPARSTIQVAALPKGAKVEIEAVAVPGK